MIQVALESRNILSCHILESILCNIKYNNGVGEEHLPIKQFMVGGTPH